MSQVYAFFDFDDTLYEGDSLLWWLRYYYGQRPMRRFFQLFNAFGLILYVFRLIRAPYLKRIFFLPMAYEKPEILANLLQAFVDTEIAPRLYPEVMQCLDTHRQKGHQVVIISASVELYLLRMQKLFPDVLLLGTELILPQGLWRLPYYRNGNLKGQNKITRLKANPNMPRSGAGCFAYSDSISDEPLLRFAEHAFVIEPDTHLQVLAQKEKWKQIPIQSIRPRWRRRLEKLRLLLFCA